MKSITCIRQILVTTGYSALTFQSIKNVILICIALFFSVQAQAAKGIVDDSRSMQSQILSKEVNYVIYLPADYQTSNRSYPTLYLMHGGGDGSPIDWVMRGNVNYVLDKMIEEGLLPPMIVITPDGRRDEENKFNTYYMNDASDAFRWEDMFIEEFIPMIEQTYRVQADKKYRAIAGLSMGGFSSLIYSFKYPELFHSAAALSAAFRTDEQVIEMDQAGYERRYGHAWGIGLKGSQRINENYLKYNVLRQVKEIPVKELSQTRYYLDCGSNDDFLIGNMQLHLEMNRRNINHRFMVREGAHDWTYWQSGLEQMLIFIGQGFQARP